MTLTDAVALFCVIVAIGLVVSVVFEYFEDEMPWDNDQ